MQLISWSYQPKIKCHYFNLATLTSSFKTSAGQVPLIKQFFDFHSENNEPDYKKKKKKIVRHPFSVLVFLCANANLSLHQACSAWIGWK
jgi:hypothetical protein